MITQEHEHFMQMTMDLSQYAADNRNDGPFGAIIVKDGKIIGSSGNSVFKDTDPCAHAEVVAIRDACRNLKSLDLSGCHIYSSSEPCPMCLAAIYWAQISSIYYCNSEKQTIKYGYMTQTIPPDILKFKGTVMNKSERNPRNKSLHNFERDLKREQNFSVYQDE